MHSSFITISNYCYLLWSSFNKYHPSFHTIKERKDRKGTLFKSQVYLALRHTNWGHCKLKLIQIKFNQMQVFEERGKPEYPGENLSDLRGEKRTIKFNRVWEYNPGHIGGRRVLSPLRENCSPIQYQACFQISQLHQCYQNKLW